MSARRRIIPPTKRASTGSPKRSQRPVIPPVVATLRTDCDAAKGRAAAEDLLSAPPEVKSIISICNDTIQGAAAALKGKHAQLTLIGFDTSDQGLQNVADGVEAAEVAQFPDSIGTLGVQEDIKAAGGESVPSSSIPARNW